MKKLKSKLENELENELRSTDTPKAKKIKAKPLKSLNSSTVDQLEANKQLEKKSKELKKSEKLKKMRE